MRYLVGNWKSNKTLQESLDWFEQFGGVALPDDLEVVICPPFPYIPHLSSFISDLSSVIKFGSQDISPFPFGAYTGAVTAEMVKDWIQYAIVGHSERRKYFHETHQEVANKVSLCLQHDISPIVCVDEGYIDQQLAAIETELIAKIVVAYEPLAAIGSGNPDTPDHAAEVAKRIKDRAEADVHVLYGGSVKPDNIKGFLEKESISGALIGGASLEPQAWQALINAFSQDK